MPPKLSGDSYVAVTSGHHRRDAPADPLQLHADQRRVPAGHLVGHLVTVTADLEVINYVIDKYEKRHTDLNNFTVILGAENGTVYAWHGRDVSGPGKSIGPDQCK